MDGFKLMDGLQMDGFHSMHGHYYFYWCSLMPHQWLSRPQSWFLSSLDMSSSLRTSLLPGIKSHPDLIYIYTFPDLESDIFLWLLLVENGILVSFYLFFWSHCLACGILVSQPGIKPRPPSLEVQHLNHETTRAVPESGILKPYSSW